MVCYFVIHGNVVLGKCTFDLVIHDNTLLWVTVLGKCTLNLVNHGNAILEKLSFNLLIHGNVVLETFTLKLVIHGNATLWFKVTRYWAKAHWTCFCFCFFLFNRSVRADTRMGPEGTKLKQKPKQDLKSLIHGNEVSSKCTLNLAIHGSAGVEKLFYRLIWVFCNHFFFGLHVFFL